MGKDDEGRGRIGKPIGRMGPVKKRRTPSVPMAALNPTPVVEVEDGLATTMEPRTRDELLLKTIARVERIDTEVEVLVESLGQADTMAEVAQDVKTLKLQMETVKGLLTKILAKL